jgi:heparan-sulfate lyase
MIRKIISTTVLLLWVMWAQSQTLQTKVFDLLDLNQPGLEQVKAHHQIGKDHEAAAALLDYYRTRTAIKHPTVNLEKVNISKDEQKWADDGLNHIFFSHRGFQPSFNYGADINWEYWPVHDNELRWQLHRTKWWVPMGKAYRISGDEKYVKEWTFQYIDWIRKNPLLIYTREERAKLTKEELSKLENVGFAWRPLEISDRLGAQTDQFTYFVKSKYFTPAFLTEFLLNYQLHAEYMMKNYSKDGNHLLFQSCRIISAGTFFPEFKNAEKWRKSGIDIINKEIGVQVYDDGFQNELDLGYHRGAIETFIQAYKIADFNGFGKEFPQSYKDKIEKMIMATMNSSFPNYESPLFSDGHGGSKSVAIRQYKEWAKLFPENKQIAYMASEGKSGELPSYLSKRFPNAGFYIFRNGWKDDATVMILKAGPPAEWHNQPDNGTFDLCIKGRNFFPDGGSYVYGGDAEVLKKRDWFRQTMVHKTLTMNNANIETMDSKCLLWNADTNVEKLVVENQGYPDLKHRRAVFFVDKTFFVIVDEAVGNAKGNVAIHYQFAQGEVKADNITNQVTTLFEDGNNLALQTFGFKDMKMIEEEGWVSYEYGKKEKRPAFGFQCEKNSEKPVRFITVIYPTTTSVPKMQAKFAENEMQEKAVNVSLKIDNKKFDLKANW